jgi:signal peptidase I
MAAAATLGGCAYSNRIQVIEKSMEPTILSGEIVTVDHRAYDAAAPAVGDIVEVHAPPGADVDRCGARHLPRRPCPWPTPGEGDVVVVKRVIALAGDHVAIRADGTAIVNGRARDEPQIIRCARPPGCALPLAMRVPYGHVFVLGDNRPYSSDSRYWGPVVVAAVTGRITPIDPSER